ncbi:MAG TPA: M15 family metallopeptidase [Steroidobacteraceae bacterium]|nr:M15 family metallopeptidase [Steroidobacteraceae bacterium]
MTGRAASHVVDLDSPRCVLHRDVVADFLALRAAAAAAGIDLAPVSSFRDFDRQLAIWNAKCRGERELLDKEGRPLDPASLDEESLVAAILYWSALPGASRHHWGTEVDVIDAAALPAGERPQLVQSEYAEGGVFAHLDRWLETNAAGHGFFRPYAVDRGGVQPEPWHLSHAAVAQAAMAQFSVTILGEALDAVEIEAGMTVAARLPEIFDRYVLNVDPAPADALAAASVSLASRPS